MVATGSRILPSKGGLGRTGPYPFLCPCPTSPRRAAVGRFPMSMLGQQDSWRVRTNTMRVRAGIVAHRLGGGDEGTGVRRVGDHSSALSLGVESVLPEGSICRGTSGVFIPMKNVSPILFRFNTASHAQIYSPPMPLRSM
jgi:hypothetical protein